MSEEYPQNLRDILLAIRDKRGTLTPEVVLDEARDPSHPLHTKFEWNNNAAAEKYRLLQAASLLRVKYRAEVGDEVRDLRAFWVAKPDENRPESEYVPIEEVILDPIARQLMLNQMRREWQTFRRRYEHMAEFSDMILGEITFNAEGA